MNPTQQVDMPTHNIPTNHWYGVGLFFTLLSISICFSLPTKAASCCGGGASSGIILPKFNEGMLDISFANENYNGFWTQTGHYQQDPKGSTLLQRRMSISYAKRLSDRFQLSSSIALINNHNQYSGDLQSITALGDTQVGIWYEAFDNVTCIYKINGWESLKPSIYLGTALTIPTGISPYTDRIDSSFDITGLGFYRLDTSMIIEKTIYPFSLSWQGQYGYTFERPVNQEYNQVVTPYNKQLGDRYSNTFSGAYTWFLTNLAMVTATLSHSQLTQHAATIDGVLDDSSGIKKTSQGLSLAYSNAIRNWIVKLNYIQATEGENIPKTHVMSMGVSHVY
ncbi:hypothetical protein NBRC116188_07960 [Oceaniserpentilla sp. 4NH20-0058]|uniref:hypothetical protein n=1 Tax=Oceaniserpentilla sp. 4NH20-0058 TaxID=3127660 RepID=UPI003107F95C